MNTINRLTILHATNLQVEGEEHKGQEKAMVAAATQNTRLLKVRTFASIKSDFVILRWCVASVASVATVATVGARGTSQGVPAPPAPSNMLQHVETSSVRTTHMVFMVVTVSIDRVHPQTASCLLAYS